MGIRHIVTKLKACSRAEICKLAVEESLIQL